MRLWVSVFPLVLVDAVAPSGPTNPPMCSISLHYQGRVYNSTIDGKPRCFATVRPHPELGPRPVLIYHHGGGGNAQRCGKDTSLSGDRLDQAADRGRFILVCTEAVQYQDSPWVGGARASGGLWNIPDNFTEITGRRCEPGSGATEEIKYMVDLIEQLKKERDVYDVSRIFIHGCSLGSAFSSYSASCVHEKYGDAISAWGLQSTGLKTPESRDVHLPGACLPSVFEEIKTYITSTRWCWRM